MDDKVMSVDEGEMQQSQEKSEKKKKEGHGEGGNRHSKHRRRPKDQIDRRVAGRDDCGERTEGEEAGDFLKEKKKKRKSDKKRDGETPFPLDEKGIKVEPVGEEKITPLSTLTLMLAEKAARRRLKKLKREQREADLCSGLEEDGDFYYDSDDAQKEKKRRKKEMKRMALQAITGGSEEGRVKKRKSEKMAASAVGGTTEEETGGFVSQPQDEEDDSEKMARKEEKRRRKEERRRRREAAERDSTLNNTDNCEQKEGGEMKEMEGPDESMLLQKTEKTPPSTQDQEEPLHDHDSSLPSLSPPPTRGLTLAGQLQSAVGITNCALCHVPVSLDFLVRQQHVISCHVFLSEDYAKYAQYVDAKMLDAFPGLATNINECVQCHQDFRFRKDHVLKEHFDGQLACPVEDCDFWVADAAKLCPHLKQSHSLPKGRLSLSPEIFNSFEVIRKAHVASLNKAVADCFPVPLLKQRRRESEAASTEGESPETSLSMPPLFHSPQLSASSSFAIEEQLPEEVGEDSKVAVKRKVISRPNKTRPTLTIFLSEDEEEDTPAKKVKETKMEVKTEESSLFSAGETKLAESDDYCDSKMEVQVEKAAEKQPEKTLPTRIALIPSPPLMQMPVSPSVPVCNGPPLHGPAQLIFATPSPHFVQAAPFNMSVPPPWMPLCIGVPPPTQPVFYRTPPPTIQAAHYNPNFSPHFVPDGYGMMRGRGGGGGPSGVQRQRQQRPALFPAPRPTTPDCVFYFPR